MRILLVFLLLAPFVFADTCPSGARDCFYCGEGGPACTKMCQGVWDENLHDYKSCECPQGKPCVCYCSANGDVGPVWMDGGQLKQPPECGRLEQCDPCASVSVLEGKVFIKRGGSWCSSSNGARVTSGDEIWVPTGSRVSLLNKEDGHTDTLASDSYVALYTGQDPSASFTTFLWTMAKGSIYAFIPPSNSYFGSPEYFAGEYAYDQMVVAGAVDRGGNPDPALLIEADGKKVTYKAILGDITLRNRVTNKTVVIEQGNYVEKPISGNTFTQPAPFDEAAQDKWWEEGPAKSSCSSAAILASLLPLAFIYRKNPVAA